MENGGWATFIYTSRGYNHGFNTYQAALKTPGAFAQKLTASQTSVFSPAALEVERQAYIDEYGQHDGDALFRQEYDCDFSAANIGAILGRYVETAEKEGRINPDVEYDQDGAGIEISSDLGRRHTSAFWFWQPRWDGFALIDYDEDAGLDAEEWAERLKQRLGDMKLKMVWLPHDAKAKTFAAKHSAVETFIKVFGADKVGIVPRSDMKSHSINAGRIVMKNCHFNRDKCSEGLNSLRSWSFKFDEERKQFSKEPQDDWACDGADAYCEGAKIMENRERPKPPPEPMRGIMVGVPSVSLDELWKTVPKPSQRI
jgi:phage terminase large subunit